MSSVAGIPALDIVLFTGTSTERQLCSIRDSQSPRLHSSTVMAATLHFEGHGLDIELVASISQLLDFAGVPSLL